MFKINDRVVHDKCGIGKVLEVYVTGVALEIGRASCRERV